MWLTSRLWKRTVCGTSRRSVCRLDAGGLTPDLWPQRAGKDESARGDLPAGHRSFLPHPSSRRAGLLGRWAAAGGRDEVHRSSRPESAENRHGRGSPKPPGRRRSDRPGALPRPTERGRSDSRSNERPPRWARGAKAVPRPRYRRSQSLLSAGARRVPPRALQQRNALLRAGPSRSVEQELEAWDERLRWQLPPRSIDSAAATRPCSPPPSGRSSRLLFPGEDGVGLRYRPLSGRRISSRTF